MNKKICLITPTYIRDFNQFYLLRKSINLFASDYNHIVIVQTEDYQAFKDRFSNEKNITVIKSKDILPQYVERFRTKSIPQFISSFKLLSKIYSRLRKIILREQIHGWHAQQISKIFSLAKCDYEVAAFVDSDCFFCKPLTDDFFQTKDLTNIYRQKASNAEQLDFDISTHEILGNKLHEITNLFDYIFHPTIFKKSTAMSLLSKLEDNFDSEWIDRFLSERRPSEYNLLGYSAMVLENGKGYNLIECDPKDFHHSIRFQGDEKKLSAEIENALSNPKGFFLIQSTLNIPFSDIEKTFDKVIHFESKV